MKKYPIFAGGSFLEKGDELPVVNPFTGEAFAQTWLADDEAYEISLIRAGQARKKLAEMPLYLRSRALDRIYRALIAEEDHFASIIAREAAKPWRYALSEVRRAAQTFYVASQECLRPPMEYMRLDWSADGLGREGLVKYFPAGMVAGISPFNFPLNLAVHKIAPAIAAGCPIILKPASATPLATLELARLVADTELPSGTLSVLPMDRKSGNKLVTDERFSLLSFTGSPEVGWRMKAEAGKKKVVLELGGNAGTIVAQTADLEHAIRRCLLGGFAYQGQVCIHAQRIFVHSGLYKDFAAGFSRAVSSLRYGDPLSSDTEITSMIDLQNAQRVEQWIQDALQRGASLLAGGKREGTYVEPTILEGAGPGMDVYDQEVFGPVVTLHPFDHFSDAVRMVNESRFGLQAGVFTRSVDELNEAFAGLEVGGVIHNDVPIFRVDHMPYGGVKDSGLGREGVRYAMLDMLEPRILVRSF